jgi:hypothetical protein
MPAPSNEPISKTNLNLFTADKVWLERRYGHGWTEIVRKLVRDHVNNEDVKRLMSLSKRVHISGDCND